MNGGNRAAQEGGQIAVSPGDRPADALSVHLAGLKGHAEKMQILVGRARHHLAGLRGAVPETPGDPSKIEAGQDGPVLETIRVTLDDLRRSHDCLAEAFDELEPLISR